MKVGRGLVAIAGLGGLMGIASCGREDGMNDGGAAPPEAEAYVLARESHRLPDGTVMVVTNAFQMVDAILTLEVDGAKQVGTMSSTNESEMRLEVVSDRISRITILKDVQRSKRALGGLPQSDPPTQGALVGRTVSFSREGTTWSGALEGGEASEEQQLEIEALAAKLGNEEAVEMFGTQPRRVGDQWEIDPSNASFLASEGEFTGSYLLSFERVEEIAGLRCAVLEGTIDVMRRTEGGVAGEGPRMRINARATIYRSLDHFENLKSEIVGDLVMAESPPLGGSRLVRGPLKISKSTELTLP